MSSMTKDYCYKNYVKSSKGPRASQFCGYSMLETVQLMPQVKAYSDTIAINLLPEVSLFT